MVYMRMTLRALAPVAIFVIASIFLHSEPRAIAAPGTPSAPKIDLQARNVLSAYRAKLASIKYLAGDFDRTQSFTMSGTNGATPVMENQGSFSLGKPDLAFVHSWSLAPMGGMVIPTGASFTYANGEYEWSYWDLTNKVYSRDNEGGPPMRTMQNLMELIAFYNDAPAISDLTGTQGAASIRYGGVSTWLGEPYRVLIVTDSESFGTTKVSTVKREYFGADNLLHRITAAENFSGGEFHGYSTTSDLQLTHLQTPSTIAPSTFAFVPPAGATEREQYPAEADTSEQPPLANGARAPDFTVYDRKGKPVKLSDYAGQVVVLDFWATWCGPCQMSLPITSQVAKAYAGKNVTVLAINTWDTKSAFDDWLPQHKQMSAIKFAIDTSPQGKDIAGTLYNVTGIPTQFVIDPAGKVAWSNVGYDDSPKPLEAAIDAALKAASSPAGAPSANAPQPVPSPPVH